jgi:V/A-type H+-transporting ATPase subunit D
MTSATGRAGRVRLQRRLAVARHGAELLDRKRRVLADEKDLLELRAAQTARTWRDAATEAAVWAGRAVALDGPAALTATAPTSPAQVEVSTALAMGVEYPVEPRTSSGPSRPVGGSSALVLAARAHRAALEAAVAHAVALRAVQVVRAELDATRTRQRAVERRLVPRLEAELDAIDRALEELEMQEAVRLRWAAGTAAPAAPGADGAEGRES